MSYRWTIKEIRDMVAIINELSMTHGTGRVELQEGSQLYGRSWRLYRLETGTHALFEHPYFSNYLGGRQTRWYLSNACVENTQNRQEMLPYVWATGESMIVLYDERKEKESEQK